MPENSLLYQEIHSQPDSIQRFLNERAGEVAAVAELIRETDHVVIAARGTSDNVARYAKYVWGARNGLQVALATPSLFSIYDKPIAFGNALVMGISQSGQSPDIVSVLTEAQRQGKPTAAITNYPDSPLAKSADVVIPLGVGEERAVAATKTYSASLMAVAAISTILNGDSWDVLSGVPDSMSKTLGLEKRVAEIAPRYRYMDRSVVIGRGFNYGTAFEIALKMKELTYSTVEAYSSADFLHGPFALIERGFPIMVIAPQMHEKMRGEIRGFLEQLAQNKAEVILLSDDLDLHQFATVPLMMTSVLPEWLSPLITILPGQLLSMYLAHERGFDIDAPRMLNKVTETK